MTNRERMATEFTTPDEQSWITFVERNEANALAKGITEDDVDRLIAEVRAENRQHGVPRVSRGE